MSATAALGRQTDWPGAVRQPDVVQRGAAGSNEPGNGPTLTVGQ